MVLNVHIDRSQIADFCRRHHICKLSLFGSVVRDDFNQESDVDVLVVFDPRFPVGFRILDMEDELSHLWGGRRVDIVNEKYLNRHLRDHILNEAQVQYAEG